MPNKLWREVHDIVQETENKTIPKKKKCKKAKWLSEEALWIAVKIIAAKSKGEKERYTHLNTEFQRIARRDKKAFLSDQCKEIEENKSSNAQNSPSQASAICEPWTFRCSSWFRKGRETRDQIVSICWMIEGTREYQKNIHFCFIDNAKAFNCVDHKKLENSSRDGNTRPPDLPPEKSVCRSRNNS